MTRYATGDVAAFEELYARHKGPLYRYFARQCGNVDAADKLFQTVWLRVIVAHKRYQPKTRFTTYLYQIAHKGLVDHNRKSGKASMGDAGEATEAAAPDPAFASGRWSLVEWETDPAAGPETGPEGAPSGAQRAERLLSALDTLSVEEREAFLLHEEAGMGLAEITEVTGANAETVKGCLRDAVTKLHTALGDPASANARGAAL